MASMCLNDLSYAPEVAAAMLKRYLAARSAVPGALATYNAFLAVGALHGALRV